MYIYQPPSLLYMKAYSRLAVPDEMHSRTNRAYESGLIEMLRREQPLLAISSAVVTKLSDKPVAFSMQAEEVSSNVLVHAGLFRRGHCGARVTNQLRRAD